MITVEKRSHDFIAYFNDDRSLWGCGRTRSEAIGDAFLTHGDMFLCKVDIAGRIKKLGAAIILYNPGFSNPWAIQIDKSYYGRTLKEALGKAECS